MTNPAGWPSKALLPRRPLCPVCLLASLVILSCVCQGLFSSSRPSQRKRKWRYRSIGVFTASLQKVEFSHMMVGRPVCLRLWSPRKASSRYQQPLKLRSQGDGLLPAEEASLGPFVCTVIRRVAVKWLCPAIVGPGLEPQTGRSQNVSQTIRIFEVGITNSDFSASRKVAS